MTNGRERIEADFLRLSDDEKAQLPLEQLVCLVLMRRDELCEEGHPNSELTSIFAAEIGIDIDGDGEDDEDAKAAKKSLADAVRDARTHKLVDFEMIDGGIRPSVTDIGQATIEASINNLRASAGDHPG